MAWLEGDLKIFAAGLAIGGKWNLGEVGDAGITVYNDVDEFDHFYIRFSRLLADFSYMQAAWTLHAYDAFLGTELSLSNFVQIGPTVIKVNCDISKCTSGVLVVGFPTGYLRYVSGKSVGSFARLLYPVNLPITVNFAYVFERGTVASNLMDAVDRPRYIAGLLYTPTPLDQAGVLPTSFMRYTESVQISYTSNNGG